MVSSRGKKNHSPKRGERKWIQKGGKGVWGQRESITLRLQLRGPRFEMTRRGKKTPLVGGGEKNQFATTMKGENY